METKSWFRYTRQFAGLIALTIILAATSVALGQGEQRQPIFLPSGSFDPLADGEPAWATAAESERAVGSYYIVQFNGPVEPAWIECLDRLGVDVLGYLPEQAHIARMAPETVAQVRALPPVRWVGVYYPAYKLDPLLVPAAAGEQADTSIEVIIIAHPDENLARLRQSLAAQGAIIVESADWPTGPAVRATLAPALLAALTLDPAIAWIELSIAPMVHNAEARRIMAVDSVWQNYGYYGEGQIVAISDTGLSVQDQLSPDFDTRLLRAYAPSEVLPGSPYCAIKTDWTDLHGHGTHVAGSLLGNGLLSGAHLASAAGAGLHAGPAPLARLVFIALNTDGSPALHCISLTGNYLALGYANGARISSNSWGAPGVQGEYTYLSSQVDDYLWRHQDYLALFAAGNEGTSGYQTIGAPATAKNVLTVGASETDRPELGRSCSDDPFQVAYFSSRGPTADGRAKPDVVAPGTTILSVLGAQASGFRPVAPGVPYTYASGTSMSTPLTAGVAAQVREWVMEERDIANPSAALLKGLIINSAAPMRGTMPNMDSGWGRVDAKNAIAAHYAILDDYRGGLTTGQAVEYTVQVLADGAAMPVAAETAAVNMPAGATTAIGEPALWAAPASAMAGSAFAFDGHGFAPNELVSFWLEGQALGQTRTGADGGLSVMLRTQSVMPPGDYALLAVQGAYKIESRFTVVSNGQSQGAGLFVTLVWTDPPALPGASRALVNDLDLLVIGPDGAITYGNGGSQPDRLNNVEGIRIENPLPGDYRVIVRATSTNGAYGAQPFALIATTAQSYGANTSGVDLVDRLSVYLPVTLH